jgi:hypothetical protein
LLSADVIADQQERLDNRPQQVIFAQQLDDPLAELHADRSSEQQSVFLDHTADPVLGIATDADQPGTSDKDGADFLALLALDPYRARRFGHSCSCGRRAPRAHGVAETTGRSTHRSACQSQPAIAAGSKPMRSA